MQPPLAAKPLHPPGQAVKTSILFQLAEFGNVSGETPTEGNKFQNLAEFGNVSGETPTKGNKFQNLAEFGNVSGEIPTEGSFIAANH